MLQAIVERLLLQYRLDFEVYSGIKHGDFNAVNPVSTALLVGLIYLPPDAHKEFQHELTPQELAGFADTFKAISDAARAEVRSKKADAIVIDVLITELAMGHQAKPLVTATNMVVYDETVIACRAGGVLLIFGYKPIVFQADLRPQTIETLETGLAPVKVFLCEQVRVLDPAPQYVPPVAIRLTDGDVDSEAETVPLRGTDGGDGDGKTQNE